MENDGGTQPPHGHRDTRNARDVGGTQQPASGQQRDMQVGQPAQDWQELVELLNKVKDNLTKEEEAESRQRSLLMMEKAIWHVNALQRRYEEHAIQSKGAKTQLDQIEAGINEIRQEVRKGAPPRPGTTPTQGQSWVAVAV